MQNNELYTIYRELQNDLKQHRFELKAGVESDEGENAVIKSHISHYLHKNNISVEDMTDTALAEFLYNEYRLYSVLTEPLKYADLEELNINGWDDIDIRLSGGRISKGEPFFSAENAHSIVRRMLRESDVVIDDAMPMAEGFMRDNLRITVVKPPVADADRGVTCSIRKLRPFSFRAEDFLRSGMCTPEMLQFLESCLNYGVSFVVSGGVCTGKTTLLNFLLLTVPDKKRIVTIEQGSRELQLIKRTEEGVITNNVVSFLSRPSEKQSQNVTQEMLVAKALRYNPDIIAVGEMRDTESYAAQEASLTGHTVVSSVHAGSSRLTHNRIAGLCRKKYPVDYQTALMQASEAFPVTVFLHRMEDNSRKIMNISECITSDNGSRHYSTLYEYRVTRNEKTDTGVRVIGDHTKPNGISESLAERLRLGGADGQLIEKFSRKDGS